GDAEDREYDLGQEGGHSRRRILHALDATGHEIIRALSERVRAEPNVVVYENHLAVDLLLDRHTIPPTCWGAYVLDRTTQEVHRFLGRVTLLCTGGAGKVYLTTPNPDIATGDGVAMASRAGAPVANMEFFQFHPTCLYHPQAKSFLVTEAIRGEGAVLRRPDGEAFMARYHPRAELAPRDVVARAIDNEMKVHGFDCVYLDITHRDADFVRGRFPTVLATSRPVRDRPRAGGHRGRPRGALLGGGGRPRPARPHPLPPPLRLRRGRLHGPPRREPPGVQLAPRGARVRPPGLAPRLRRA